VDWHSTGRSKGRAGNSQTDDRALTGEHEGWMAGSGAQANSMRYIEAQAKPIAYIVDGVWGRIDSKIGTKDY
jgi:hypothetical protein